MKIIQELNNIPHMENILETLPIILHHSFDAVKYHGTVNWHRYVLCDILDNDMLLVMDVELRTGKYFMHLSKPDNYVSFPDPVLALNLTSTYCTGYRNKAYTLPRGIFYHIEKLGNPGSAYT